MSLLEELVGTFAKLSILSIGGANATVPEIHRQVVVVHHWMNDETFAKLVAIGQTAPGPNVLIVSMIGWHLVGIAGLLAVTAAILVPSSMLALAIGRVLARFDEGGRASLVRRALAPIAVGFMLASAVVLARAAFQGLWSLALTLAVAAILGLTRLSPIWCMAGGAVVGIAVRRLQVPA